MSKPSVQAQRRYPPELKERAVRMVKEAIKETGRRHGVVTRVSVQLGIGSETLRSWVKQDEIDRGARPGVSPTRASERQNSSGKTACFDLKLADMRRGLFAARYRV